MASRYRFLMAATVAMPQKKLLRRLMKSGRWNSESEIVRYGIELVRREIEKEQYSPLPEGVLAEAYRKMSAEDHKLDQIFGKASARPEPEKLT
jgi:Arc/MetJ-type ribon-helix-helix transcriptional regulator